MGCARVIRVDKMYRVCCGVFGPLMDRKLPPFPGGGTGARSACPGRSAARSMIYQWSTTVGPRCAADPGPPRAALWAVPDQRCTTRSRSRCIASGTHKPRTRSHPLFTCQTATLLRSRGAISAPGFLQPCSDHPQPRGGGAPRDVRVQRHPFGVPSCVKDARQRACDAARQAPSEAPCVP